MSVIFRNIAKFKSSNIISCNNYWKVNSILPQNIQCRHLFWEKDRKGGYEFKEKQSILTHLKNGIKELKEEINLSMKELKELAETDPLLIARPGKKIILYF